jgi:hypothetical protein
MNKLSCGLLAALATLGAAPSAFAAAERPGFDAHHTEALAGMPVHVVVINDRLLVQAPFSAWSEDPKGREHVLERAASSGYGPASARVPELLGSGLPGRDPVELAREAGAPLAPSWGAIRAAGCDLAGGAAFAQAVEAAVRASAWGANATIQRHAPLARGAKEDGPHYEFEIRHSFTPDLAAIVTTVLARAHSPTLPDAPSVWENRPNWTDELVIVSDAAQIGATDDAERAAAVERENARYHATGIADLARRAKRGDAAAREQGWLINQEHERALADARSAHWVWMDSAARSVGWWTDNQCAHVRQALDANAAETTRVLGLLFAGQLDALSSDWYAERKPLFGHWVPTTRNVAGPAGERKLYSDGEHIVVSRRAGDDVMLDFRYSWFVDPAMP